MVYGDVMGTMLFAIFVMLILLGTTLGLRSINGLSGAHELQH